jgi:GNAT superfamily N-acetyltransferase
MTSTAIEISPPNAQQYAAWLPLWRAYQTFYKVDIPAEVTAVTWARLLDPAEPMGAALAWDQGRAVGLVHHIRHRSCWSASDEIYLQDLFVTPDVRGGGIGRRLIEHVYQLAREQGCSSVHWLTHETNTQAMILYDRAAMRSGFVEYQQTI